MIQNKPALINVSSSTLMNGEYMPQKYICERQHVHPPFSFRGLPLETASIAMTLEKVQENGGVFDHWVIWNMQPTPAIAEGSAKGITGKNSHGQNKYMGPYEPFGDYYRLQVYALNKMLSLDEGSGKKELHDAMEGHILAMGSMNAYCEIAMKEDLSS